MQDVLSKGLVETDIMYDEMEQFFGQMEQVVLDGREAMQAQFNEYMEELKARQKVALEEQRRQLDEELEKQAKELSEQSQRWQEELEKIKRLHEQQLEMQRKRAQEELAEAKRQHEERLALQEAEKQRRLQEFSFSSRHDPILCAHNATTGEIIDSSCINYTGTAVIMCYDRRGLQKMVFVAVSDEDGSNYMGENAWFVADTWEVSTCSWQWSYHNDTAQHVAQISCNDGRPSELPQMSQPPFTWLQAFDGSKTFLLHALQPRIMHGPKYELIRGILTDNDVSAVPYDNQRLGQWLNAMLMLKGYAMEYNIHSKALKSLTEYIVFWGIAHARKSML
mmetsp:Transcript_5608/g.9318  ORF Transcript_5608/g.9318 Transcript_5608/m.9318 type:complete len:336 (-) Transcript_5608:82-1089(-)